MAGRGTNLSPKQRAEVQRQIARAYRVWRSRYGEPTEKEREAIVSIGFKEARKRMPSIPAANPDFASAIVSGIAGAVVGRAMRNPEPEWPSEVYRGRERVRGWTVPVSPTSADYSTGGKLIRRRLPGKTKQEHLAVGDAHARAGFAADVAHREIVDVELAGLQGRRIDPGPLISGIVSGQFPEDVKSKLRTLAHESSERKSAAMAHYAAAGLRLHTARERLHRSGASQRLANPLVTMPAAPFMEIGPAAAMPLNSNGRGPWVIYNWDEKRVVSGPIGSYSEAQARVDSALDRMRIGGGILPHLTVVTLRSARSEGLEVPGEETVGLHESKKACPTCGAPLSLMATLDKTRFWWECPSGHTVQLNPLLMTVMGANPYAGGPTVDESPRIARLRDIAASGVDTEFEGVLLDPMSASVLVQVHDALPVASRTRFARLPLPRMGNLAMQAMMKRSANPGLSFEYPEGASKPSFHTSVTGGARRLSMVTPSQSMQAWPTYPASGLEAGVYDDKTGRWGYHYGSSAILRDTYSINPRAVHESIVDAFFRRQPRRIGERYATDGQALRVWGNLVAEWRPEGLYITDAGWRTSLTKNVLNQILLEAFRNGYQSGQLGQTKFEWHLYPFTPQGSLDHKRKIEWTGGMVLGSASVAPMVVPAANPGTCPPICLNPLHEHKGKGRGGAPQRTHKYVYRGGRRWPMKRVRGRWVPVTRSVSPNPAHRGGGRKTTMTLEEFARRVKATKNPKLWQDFLAKIRGYKKWSHGTLPKQVTVETVSGAPGMKGIMLTYDAGKAPEATYIMPKGTKRKGAWRHPWSKMPAIKHDPEAGLVIHKVGKGQVTNFYHK